MRLYLKNISGGEFILDGIGAFIADGEYFDAAQNIPEIFYESSDEIVTAITNDNILVSVDGVSDFSKADSLQYFQNISGTLLGGIRAPDQSELVEGLQCAIVRNSDSSTNLNTSSDTEVPITGTIDQLDSVFSVVGNKIRVNGASGYLMAYCNLYLFAAAQRTNLNVNLTKNGTVLPSTGAGGYIRNTSDHNNSSISVMKMIQVVDGDEIGVVSSQEAGNGTVTMPSGQSELTLCFFPAALAKGEKGENSSGFQFFTQNGFPDNQNGLDSDVYLDMDTSSLYKKISGTWVLQGSVNTGKNYAYVYAEESSSLSSGAYEWSMGDSENDDDFGLIMMRPGKIVGMSLMVGNDPDPICTVEVRINKLSIGKSVSVSEGSLFNSVDFSSNPYSFTATDRLNFRTVLSGGVFDGGVVGVLVEFD